jgi:hypothetical protein
VSDAAPEVLAEAVPAGHLAEGPAPEASGPPHPASGAVGETVEAQLPGDPASPTSPRVGGRRRRHRRRHRGRSGGGARPATPHPR